jgi:hypothetical protein
LQELDSERTDKGLVEKSGEIPAGLNELLFELDNCYKQLDDVSRHTGSNNLERELHHIKQELVKFAKHPKSLTWKDLLPVQNRLRSIEAGKIDGKYFEFDGRVPPNQADINKLYSECHRMKEHILNEIKEVE